MELRHLRYFVAVAEEENVTRAAARLRVSQPPLTRQIHDLEEELGVALFDRNGKSIRLTDAGRMFLKGARESLKRVEDAVQAVRAAAAGMHGELHIGYAPSPTIEILPRLLRAFRKQWPGVSVILHDLSSPEMLAGLRDDRLQAAIMMEPTKQAARGLAFEKLRTYPTGVAVPANHDFARRRAAAIDDVLAEPIVAYSRGEYPDYHEFVARTLGARAKSLRIVEECDSGPSLIAAVESGLGICVCASTLVATAGRRLKFVPLVPAAPPAVVGIACRRQRLSQAAAGFAEAARSQAQPGYSH